MRVAHLPFQPHVFAFGGFEIQALMAIEASRAVGVDAFALNPWDRDASLEVLHCWGLEVVHAEAVEWAKKSGRRVVISALCSYPTSWWPLKVAGNLLRGHHQIRARLVQQADCITVVNEGQAQYLQTVYRCPKKKLKVVPNVVPSVFQRREEVNSGHGVVCVGNICRRKNQLNLAKAADIAGVNLTLVGSVVPGEEEYADQVQTVLSKRSGNRWLRDVRANSSEMITAYREAACFALVSRMEQQPISALEAGTVGLPLLLSDHYFAKYQPFTRACLVPCDNPGKIAAGLTRVLERPEHHCVPAEAIARFSARAIGLGYANCYGMEL